jgi:hypothetical protein
LVKSGFGDLFDYVDKFKAWQEEAPDEERSFGLFKSTYPVCYCNFLISCLRYSHLFFSCFWIPLTFTADEENLCYVATIRCGARLLSIKDFLIEKVPDRLFAKHPHTKRKGVNWSEFTYLLQTCNGAKKKDTNQMIKFAGKKSETNLVKRRNAAVLDRRELDSIAPGVYICCVGTATAGHMLVLHHTEGKLWVHDST